MITSLKHLSPDEESALTTLVSKHVNRDTLLISLALNTGARCEELLMLTKGSFNPSTKSVLIKACKGSNDREIPLTDQLWSQVEAHIETLAPTDLVFDICSQRVRQIWDHWRPGKKKFHSLRHTFAINLYRRTKDLRLVQVALGHKSINSTMVYAAYLYSQEELRKAMGIAV
jgi:integrase